MKGFGFLRSIFTQAHGDGAFNPREAFGLKGDRHLADSPEEHVCARHGISPEKLYSAIEQAGLTVLRLDAKDMEARRAAARENWFYVYDKKDMQQFLDNNKQVLEEAGWPTTADRFVDYMSQVSAPANTAIFDLIHASYGGDPETGNNGWLRRNSGGTPEAQIKSQQAGAELTRQRYKAMRENDPAAVEWFREKAGQGHIGAMYDLSDMCAQGRGCKQDMAEAAYWFRLGEMRSGPAENRQGAPDTYARSEQPDFHLSKAQEEEVAQRLAAVSARRPAAQGPRT